MLMDMWSEGIFGRVLFFILLITLLALVVIIVGLIFQAANTMGLNYKKGRANIIHKRHEPAYQTTIMVPITTGKTTTFMPQIIYHPESFILTLSVMEQGKLIKGEKNVDKNTYHQVQVGEEIIAEFAKNRFTNSFSIR